MASKTIVIIAGEASGDALGAGLMLAMQAQDPDLQFEGIGGPKMVALGFTSLVPMERLTVMGLVEVLGRLPELWGLRRRLIKRYSQQHPLAFIGIDAPDFNLVLETKLKAVGVTTLHYVSPSVWAWRPERVFTVANACHHVLALLPFEVPYYQRHKIPATYVGHRLADELPGEFNKTDACQKLGIDAQHPVLAILPGSRGGEVAKLGDDFIAAAKQLQSQHPTLQILVAAANDDRQQQLTALLEKHHLAHNAASTTQLINQHTWDVLAASDAVLVASGTATLEAMLFNKPMLVCYRLNALSYRLLQRKITTPYVSLPNLLADKMLVEELLQNQVKVPDIVTKMSALLFDETVRAAQQTEFIKLRHQLACQADTQAAQVVFAVIAASTQYETPL